MKTLKSLKWAGVPISVLVFAFAGAQFVKPEPSNLKADDSHSIRAQFAESPIGLAAVLDRACGDCHSNTVSSRWYAQVAPFSFLFARGAKEGRKAVNFSEWTAYSAEQQRALLAASCTDAKDGRMPMAAYLRLRPDAKLSARDVEMICDVSR